MYTSINKKLKGGENICFAQLALAALERNGNAIIGVDIDYSELGGLKGIIMVCMTGTAIKLNNPDILGNLVAGQLVSLSKLSDRLQYLRKILKEIWNIY